MTKNRFYLLSYNRLFARKNWISWARRITGLLPSSAPKYSKSEFILTTCISNSRCSMNCEVDAPYKRKSNWDDLPTMGQTGRQAHNGYSKATGRRALHGKAANPTTLIWYVRSFNLPHSLEAQLCDHYCDWSSMGCVCVVRKGMWQGNRTPLFLARNRQSARD